MNVGPELLTIAGAVLGQWLHLWRRSARNEQRLADVHACLDDAQMKLGVMNERLSKIEGRMEERDMRWRTLDERSAS
jgi:chromosome segregation ATPase